MSEVWRTIFHSDVSNIVDYKIENLALMFFIFAFIGFVWEVIYTAVTEKVVAKRGMLRGPWVPLYGVGGVLMLLLLGRFRANPPLVFFLAMVLCGTVEYFTGVLVERFYGQRWWDYSTKRINFRGRICFSGILLFGVSGTAAVCGFGPPLNDNIARLSFPIHMGLVAVLGIIFIVDVITSAMSPNEGKGITYEIKSDNKEKIENNNTTVE